MSVNSFENYYLSWKPDLSKSEGPLYLSLAAQLEESIQSGALLPGTKLPPQRELADYLDINLSTVTRALKLCTQKGLIVSSTGNGTYVSSDVIYNDSLLGNAEDKSVEMGAILPSKDPNKYVVSAIESVIKEPNILNLLQYNSNQYNTRQRMMGAKWLAKTGIQADYQRILLAAGGQNALMAILAGLFQRGDKVGCHVFTYPGLKSAAKLLGIVLVPIADYSKDTLERVHKQHHLKGIYLVADYNNPTTEIIPETTRKVIADFGRKNQLYLLEDGINALLSEHPLTPIYQYAPEQTIYFSSLSKTIAPGLRLSYLIAPKALEEALFLSLYNMNISVSPLLAQTAAILIQSHEADNILAKRKALTRRRNLMVNAILNPYEIMGDDFCPFRWIPLPKGHSSHSFELLAKASNIRVFAADRFLVGKSLPYEAIRISVVSEESEERFEAGLRTLRQLLAISNDDSSVTTLL